MRRIVRLATIPVDVIIQAIVIVARVILRLFGKGPPPPSRP